MLCTGSVLKTLEEKVSPGHVAVVVVDMQNDFCHSQGAMARQGRNVLSAQAMAPTLVQFIAQARRCRVPVIFIRQINTEYSQSEAWLEHRKRVNPEHFDAVPCWEGSWGADFYAVRPEPGESIVTKHRYSGFHGTDLDLILRSRGIKTIILAGVQTNACVECTARDGLIHDYYVVFLKDGTATESDQAHDWSLRNIHDLVGLVATTAEICSVWGTPAKPSEQSVRT